MNSGDTILAMTPMKKVTQWYWVCQRKECKHEWPAKDINVEPKRCAKCKRLDWNRKTLKVGRPKGKTKGQTKKGKK